MLTLFRGEDPSRCATLNSCGVQAKVRWAVQGFPARDWRELLGLPAWDLPRRLRRFLDAHVLQKQASPFVSFSAKRVVAERYAFHNYTREEGLLVTTTINIVESLAWDTYPRPGTGILTDSAGRRWIRVSGFRFGFEEVAQPDRTEALRRQGAADDEYLVVGDLLPSEFHRQHIAMRPTP